MVQGFPPVVGPSPRLLLLGTMPSVKSLQEQRYYAHPRNAFWPVLYALYGQAPPPDFDTRYAFARDHHIALWDVAQQCKRQGSSDAAIREVVPNDIVGLLTRQPSIQAVGLNGGEALRLFDRLIRPALPRPIPVLALPSTSPAYTLPWTLKAERWRQILDHYLP
jgi:TDG/mug DNA glycosylase family protein